MHYTISGPDLGRLCEALIGSDPCLTWTQPIYIRYFSPSSDNLRSELCTFNPANIVLDPSCCTRTICPSDLVDMFICCYLMTHPNIASWDLICIRLLIKTVTMVSFWGGNGYLLTYSWVPAQEYWLALIILDLFNFGSRFGSLTHRNFWSASSSI